MIYNTPGDFSPSDAAAPIFPYPDFMDPLPPPLLPPFPTAGDPTGPTPDDRFPWSHQETSDLIEIRAQLDGETHGKKISWVLLVGKMRERGYSRTIFQCRSKWNNLVTKYKAQLENGQECPFFNELHAFFTARENNRLYQAQIDSEVAPFIEYRRLENAPGYQSHEEEENEDDAYVATRKKAARGKRQTTVNLDIPSMQPNESIVSSIGEMLRNFMKQQQRIEMQWNEAMEKCAQEREVFEQEWRQTMENLERERMLMEQAWREREEQQRQREESQAERRDALLTTLLNKLIDEVNS